MHEHKWEPEAIIYVPEENFTEIHEVCVCGDERIRTEDSDRVVIFNIN